MPWNSILDDYYKSIADKLETIDYKQSKKDVQEETDIKCEKCGSPMIIRWAKNGQFLGCSDYPKCKNIKNFTRDDDGTIHVIEPEKIDEKCPECGSDLTIKNGRFGKFIACTNYPKCKFTKPFTLGTKCPKCGDGEVVERKDKRGRTFYGCSKYPDCDYISRYKPGKSEMLRMRKRISRRTHRTRWREVAAMPQVQGENRKCIWVTSIGSSLASIWSHKLRSLLTLTGIMIAWRRL